MPDLTAVKDDFVTCRVRRHRWEAVEDDKNVYRDYQSSVAVARFASKCDRCGTIRYEAWNRLTGEILFATYVYPDGYRIEGGARLFNVRKEYMDRTMPHKKPKKFRK